MKKNSARNTAGLLKGGKIGNKGGGRPKLEVTALAKQYTEEAINRLAFWMRSDNAKASVTAATALLDRGHGKPSQMLSNDPENPFESPIFLLPEQKIGHKGGIS